MELNTDNVKYHNSFLKNLELREKAIPHFNKYHTTHMKICK